MAGSKRHVVVVDVVAVIFTVHCPLAGITISEGLLATVTPSHTTIHVAGALVERVHCELAGTGSSTSLKGSANTPLTGRVERCALRTAGAALDPLLFEDEGALVPVAFA